MKFLVSAALTLVTFAACVGEVPNQGAGQQPGTNNPGTNPNPTNPNPTNPNPTTPNPTTPNPTTPNPTTPNPTTPNPGGGGGNGTGGGMGAGGAKAAFVSQGIVQVFGANNSATPCNGCHGNAQVNGVDFLGTNPTDANAVYDALKASGRMARIGVIGAHNGGAQGLNATGKAKWEPWYTQYGTAALYEDDSQVYYDEEDGQPYLLGCNAAGASSGVLSLFAALAMLRRRRRAIK